MSRSTSARTKSFRSDAEIELDQRVSDHMKESQRYVVSEAREAVLRLEPCLAARIDALTKGRTPR
jgi:hypothetical protein